MQVSFVGATEEAAREKAQKDGYSEKVAVTKTSFKANSKVAALHAARVPAQEGLLSAPRGQPLHIN